MSKETQEQEIAMQRIRSIIMGELIEKLSNGYLTGLTGFKPLDIIEAKTRLARDLEEIRNRKPTPTEWPS